MLLQDTIKRVGNAWAQNRRVTNIWSHGRYNTKFPRGIKLQRVRKGLALLFARLTGAEQGELAGVIRTREGARL